MTREAAKPTIPEVVSLIREYYTKPGNAVGGEFHVILDDGNHEQCFANSALARVRELGDELGTRIGAALVTMSSTQRKKLARMRFL